MQHGGLFIEPWSPIYSALYRSLVGYVSGAGGGVGGDATDGGAVGDAGGVVIVNDGGVVYIGYHRTLAMVYLEILTTVLLSVCYY